jgi:hypothetical protein
MHFPHDIIKGNIMRDTPDRKGRTATLMIICRRLSPPVGGGEGDVIVRHGWPPALRRHSVSGPLIYMQNPR